MDLGVDFGTTRTFVAFADRGNYPVASFLDDEGDAHEFFPSVVSCRGDDVVYGFAALTAAAEGGPLVRSFKRLLARPDVSADLPVQVGDRAVPLLTLLTGYMTAVREALTERSSISARLGADGLGATVVAVPAHAHGTQRFLTLEAFRRAGFTVTGMLNEPSAAGFEYTHHRGRTLSSRRTRVVVYDLGAGTFDASLVCVDGSHHDVIASLGMNQLGGDDFDQALVECALETAKTSRTELTRRQYRQLVEECREAKEHLSPQSRRIALEVGTDEIVVPTDDFYARAATLVESTVEAMAPLIDGLDEGEPDLTEVAGVYLVGGASGLPLVPRMLRARFGRRVHRSPYPAASTAIGLAIAADPEAGYHLRDRLSRGFGVFREAAGGRDLTFDPILDRTAPLPQTGATVITREYRAAHNVGWFRFVEYTDVDVDGQPYGDLVPFAEVVFPFDPMLQRDEARRGSRAGGSSERAVLAGVAVERRDDGPAVRETYSIDANGIVQVCLQDLETGYQQEHRLQAW
ncbi:Hsp70 family protein [Austwickia sp. TVS 96-490-7B]|uniref:Hsp70 family protein n=1 Tax=Austwickia sp. TVS 96-490-7B TaxID=2830843 RepID=UPI001C59F865|nr:Hsp70 family protein [Austwickia sp. TVS 96-490-7B]